MRDGAPSWNLYIAARGRVRHARPSRRAWSRRLVRRWVYTWPPLGGPLGRVGPRAAAIAAVTEDGRDV